MALRISQKLNARLWVRFAASVLILTLTVPALFHGLMVRAYTVQSGKLSAGNSVRIAVIADLHSHVWGEDQQPLLDMIASQQPDLIALVGDIVDDREPMSGVQLFLERVTEIALTYYVSGNHEFWSDEYDSVIRDMIESDNITVIDNKRLNLNVKGVKLCLCGVDDPEVFDYTDDPELLALGSEEALLRDRFSDLDDGTYNILLAHRPELIEDYLPNFDLILSGHTHGGQIRIPLLINGLWAPDQGWLPEYAGGRYDFGEQTMIVSRGCGVEAKLPRVFNAPEITVVDISGKA
jgi:predicted MPP superfamily phosphohydrolase